MGIRQRIVLDAGALLHVESLPSGRIFRMCERAMRQDAPALLPSVVFAQVWRESARQAPLARLRKLCDEVAFTPATADSVGLLLRLSGTSDVVDAAVMVEAFRRDSLVVTSDPDDIQRLAETAGYKVPMIVV